MLPVVLGVEFCHPDGQTELPEGLNDPLHLANVEDRLPPKMALHTDPRDGNALVKQTLDQANLLFHRVTGDDVPML